MTCIANLSPELITHILSFLDDDNFIKLAFVCKRWRNLRIDHHLCRERYQRITQTTVDFLEYQKISTHKPDTHLMGQLKKRKHPTHIFPFGLSLFCKLEKPPENLHWHENDAGISQLRVNQIGNCCSYIDASHLQSNCIYSKKRESICRFDPTSSLVWIADLNKSEYHSTTFSVKHSKFPTASIPYFDGSRVAVLHTDYGIYPESAITIFDNTGKQTHSFQVASCDAIVLDNNLCWVFSAGTNVHIWNISTTTPFEKEYYNFSDELMELSKGSYCRDIVLAEIDSHHEKLGVAFEDGSIVIIESNRILQNILVPDSGQKKKRISERCTLKSH